MGHGPFLHGWSNMILMPDFMMEPPEILNPSRVRVSEFSVWKFVDWIVVDIHLIV